jgi:hypothetical protein
MRLREILESVPAEPTVEYTTRRGTPGITYKFPTGQYWVTVSVTGASERKLPNEVAAALAAWALSILSDRAK